MYAGKQITNELQICLTTKFSSNENSGNGPEHLQPQFRSSPLEAG